MARYDRIAPLPPPARKDAIPGWCVFLDLEDDDRDEEIAQRARLRFLALRPLHRLLRQGLPGFGYPRGPAPDTTPDGSPDAPDSEAAGLRIGLDELAEELGHLPARDPERAALRSLIHAVDARQPARVCDSMLMLGAAALHRQHVHGAEEIARTAIELANAFHRPGAAARARTLLARTLRCAGRLDAAAQEAARALAAAREGPADGWLEAMQEHMRILRLSGDAATAQRDFDALAAAAEKTADAELRQELCVVLCDELLERGEPELAAERAWGILEQLDDRVTQPPLVERLATALRRLGLFEAAEHAYAALERLSTDGEARAGVRAEQALMAAARGDAAEFHRRRLALTEPDATEGLIANHLEAQLALGRGCVLVGETDCAQAHLGLALDLAELDENPAAAELARELLSELDRRRDAPVPYAEPLIASPGPAARRVASALSQRIRA